VAMELAEFLDREAGTSEEQRVRFTIDDEQKANWALRKIRKLTEKRKANIQLAEAEIERINTWLKEVNGDLEQSIDYFTGLLEGYHRQVLEQDPKAKTIKLPYGKLKMRAQQPEFIRDNDKLLSWLKQSNKTDYIVVKESPDWAQLKKTLQVAGNALVDTETGEVVEGVEVVEREPKFSVEVE